MDNSKKYISSRRNCVLKLSDMIEGVISSNLYLYGSSLCFFSSLLYMYYKMQMCSKLDINKVITTSDLSTNDTYRYRKHVRSIIELLDKSKHSIYIAMYLFTIRDFSSALIRAQRRGVDIKVILDGTMINCMGSQRSKLVDEGIEVRYNKDLNFLIHHKFCLIDSQPKSWFHSCFRYNPKELPSNGVVITGSQNWTRQAMTGNWEYQIFTSSPRVVSQYNEEFKRIWKIFESCAQ